MAAASQRGRAAGGIALEQAQVDGPLDGFRA
jgi:hypothetical protein